MSYKVRANGRLDVRSFDVAYGKLIYGPADWGYMSEQQFRDLQETVRAAGFNYSSYETAGSCNTGVMTWVDIEWSDGTQTRGTHPEQEETFCDARTLDGDLKSVMMKLAELANELEIGVT